MSDSQKIAPKIAKGIYKTLRSIIFSLTLAVVGVYLVAYILLSIPSFTNWVKDRATLELSEFLGGKVYIEDFKIYPFNEARISGLQVFDQEGRQCLYVETIGAGIRLWKLISEKQIDLTFGEIIDLDARIIQEHKDAPLNIDFIIKAFKGEEKKEKTPFELSLKNVVLRKSHATFERPWVKGQSIGNIDLSRLEINDLAADLTFPKISDKGVEVDLRRLSLSIPGCTRIEKLAFKGSFGSEGINIQDFIFEMPESRITLPSLVLPMKEGTSVLEILSNDSHELQLTDCYITPAEFSFLYAPLASFTEKINIELQARGNLKELRINNFYIGNPEILTLSLNGDLNQMSEISKFSGDIANLNLNIKEIVFSRLINSISQLPVVAKDICEIIGEITLKGDMNFDMASNSAVGDIQLHSDIAELNWNGKVSNYKGLTVEGEAEMQVTDFPLDKFLPGSPVGNINAAFTASGIYSNGNAEGNLNLLVDNLEFKGKSYDGLTLNLNKEGEQIEGDIEMHNALAHLNSTFSGDISGEYKQAQLELDLESLDLSQLIDLKNYDGYDIACRLSVDAQGKSFDDLIGHLNLTDFSFTSPDSRRSLELNQLQINASLADSIHTFYLESDWMDLRAEGVFKLEELPLQIKELAASVFPSFINRAEVSPLAYSSSIDFDLLIKKDNTLADFFNLPVRMLVPINLEGTLEGSSNTATFTLDVPYLQQGKDKLIYDSRIVANIDGNEGNLNALITTTLPIKKGDLAINIDLFGHENVITSDIHWHNTENTNFRGLLSLSTELAKNSFTHKPVINTEILPSVMRMGTQEWNLTRSEINYSDKNLAVKGFKIWHDDQLVEIEGKASEEYDDEIQVTLADIDVDYIFGMLNINYVTFGGVATGKVIGRALFSGNPVAETDGVLIKEFTYNGADLGECLATSSWNNHQKKIEIGADITKDGRNIVKGDGGIWLGRDSLSFDIHAMKAPVKFVQPFMEVFSSYVDGCATGDVKLFGTFHDIDMTGKVFADSVAIKLDYTNTVYHGSDSVIFNPGQIEIPHFRLYDKYGNSGVMIGELTHRYFHDPSFTFRLTEASNLLCYDTNSDLNPDWYGTLFGTGSALVKGAPGWVDISADMTIAGNSNFTFVLNETQYAQDYPFLTFSNKRKVPEVKKDEPSPLDFKAMLKKTMQPEESAPSKFGIDIRASITPQALFTLVMDPAAGDKITARGRGAMQVKYESDDDEMTMYGKYEIAEGNYNFSLQEIILRDFKIKEGSSISFNGNPLAAHLDISATYRVNTNLTDLDKSFSTDRELNRTNVPVDAVLSVNGNMQHPDITFDIELPTLTQDVERKVKSIISTDDMMNRQIIYLLALNRFYTPEYMGSGSNGGELAAVASSTISSQLSNILGQLTDKLSVSPSFRSDKGDFSDIEVDVALSSKLLNNRLLINGNFGYRDRSNSSTTFVGDFDVEYLLSKNGNLRLKAYNHFNDQNYYLREALTTQGLGVVYRRDFDNWFTFLRRKRSNVEESDKKEGDKSENPERPEEDETTENEAPEKVQND